MPFAVVYVVYHCNYLYCNKVSEIKLQFEIKINYLQNGNNLEVKWIFYKEEDSGQSRNISSTSTIKCDLLIGVGLTNLVLSIT